MNFPLYEFQSKWIAGALSGRLSLPSEEMMMEDVKSFYLELEAKGAKKCNTHKIHDFTVISILLHFTLFISMYAL